MNKKFNKEKIIKKYILSKFKRKKNLMVYKIKIIKMTAIYFNNIIQECKLRMKTI